MFRYIQRLKNDAQFRINHLGHESINRHHVSGGLFCSYCPAYSLHAIPRIPRANETVADYAAHAEELGFRLMTYSQTDCVDAYCEEPLTTTISGYRKTLRFKGRDIVLFHENSAVKIYPRDASLALYGTASIVNRDYLRYSTEAGNNQLKALRLASTEEQWQCEVANPGPATQQMFEQLRKDRWGELLGLRYWAMDTYEQMA